MAIWEGAAAFRASAAQTPRMLEGAGPWRQLMAVTALLLCLPWLLFFGDIFPHGDVSFERRALGLALFVLVSAITLALAGSLLARRPPAKGLGLVGTGLLSVGLTLLLLRGSFAGAPLAGGATGLVPGVSIVLCAIGYSLLLLRWLCGTYSRMTKAVASVLVPLSALGSVVLFALCEMMAEPYGGWVAFAATVGCLIWAHVTCREGTPDSRDTVATLAGADAFVMQSGTWVRAILALSAVAFGGNLVILYADGFLSAGLADESLAYMGWVFLALAVLLLCAIASPANSGMFSLVLAALLVLAGGMVAGRPSLGAVQATLLNAGFFCFCVFYLVFYNATAQRKDCGEREAVEVFWHTMSLFPAFVCAGAVLTLGLNAAAPLLAPVVCMVSSLGLVACLLALFAKELVATRRALLERPDTPISLADIRSFASGPGASHGLTPRECEVMHLMLSGRSVSAAAEELFVSESTVKTHLRSVYRKLDVHNRQEMIRRLTELMR